MIYKPPIHIKYNRLCYYCICQACNLVRCPFTHGKHKSRFDVCVRCLDRPNPRPRLDCDFFMHYRKVNVFRVKPFRYLDADSSSKRYVILKNGVVYGPFTVDEVVTAKRVLHGIVRELNSYDI